MIRDRLLPGLREAASREMEGCSLSMPILHSQMQMRENDLYAQLVGRHTQNVDTFVQAVSSLDDGDVYGLG